MGAGTAKPPASTLLNTDHKKGAPAWAPLGPSIIWCNSLILLVATYWHEADRFLPEFDFK